MKQSGYNFFIQRGDDTLCFNAISLKHFLINSKKADALTHVLNHPESYKDKLPNLYTNLLEGHFINDEVVNEIDVIREHYYNQVYSKNYKLVLLPTLECNFRCWYCVQSHVKGMMTESMISRICNHIEHMIKHEKITSLNVDWFGGEPFLYFEKVIKPISEFARKICKEYDIPFFSTATSNAYLVTPEVIDQMIDYNFTSFQITIDGDRDHHNKTRVSKKSSSFDTILNNLNYLCSKIEDISITLRINYDDQNLYPARIINQINEIIHSSNKHKITFLFRKIWQVVQVKDDRSKLKEALNLLVDLGYKNAIDFNSNYVPCYASQKYYNTISFNGNVYKCTAKNSMHENSLGHLNGDGTIKWNIDDFERKYYKQPLFENDKCLKCKYLPLCMGPCSRRLEDNGLEKPKFYCTGRANGFKFEDTILSYCEQN